MKKTLSILLMVLLILTITGCHKKNEFDVDLKTDAYMSICEREDDSDGIKLSTETTTNFNSDKYAINMKIKAVYKYETKESFDFYLEETKHTFDTYKKMKNVVFKYKVNKEKKTIKTLLVYKKFDLTDKNKELYTYDTIIKSSLAENANCKSIDIKKKELSLKNE